MLYIPEGKAATVNASGALRSAPSLAVKLAVPGATPVTSPEELMLAAAGLLLLQSVTALP